MKKTLIFALFSALTVTVHAEPLWVGKFDGKTGTLPAGWKVERLSDQFPATEYKQRNWDGVNAIEATAVKSMALFGRTLAVDLEKTPILCWRWRVDAPLANADLNTKAGDDYAARVYLTFTVPREALSFATRTKLSLARSIWGPQVPDAALNYVWDNKYPIGTSKPNAYTDRTQMLVIETGVTNAGRWVTARRNVADDFKRAFANIPGRLSGMALASDTDNTGESAHAGFADFHFVADKDACATP